MHLLSRVLYDLPPSPILQTKATPSHCRLRLQTSKTCTCTAGASFPRSAETQILNPRASSCPRCPSKRQERTPRQVPADPAPFSLTGLLPCGGLECRRKPCAPSLLRPSPPLRRRLHAHLGREAGLQWAVRNGQLGDAALADPGSGPAALRLQPGRTAPTRQQQPRDGDAAPTSAPRPLPARPFSPLGNLGPPACPLPVRPSGLTKSPLRAQRPVTLRGPSLSSAAAKSSLSRAGPAAPAPPPRFLWARPCQSNLEPNAGPEVFKGAFDLFPWRGSYKV